MFQKKILSFSIYDENPWGHGGEKHTHQLAELFSDNHIKRIRISRGDESKLNIYSLVNSLFLIAKHYDIKRFISIRIFLRYWKYVSLNYNYLNRVFKSEYSVLFIETSKDYFYYIVFLAQKFNKRIICFVHNIESLVSEQNSLITRKNLAKDFKNELRMLKLCDLVCTVSKEDTHLLRLFGINAMYVPYYPSAIVEDWLLNIRKKREVHRACEYKEVMIMGTAINAPTRIGIENIINYFYSNGTDGMILNVGGYGSEIFNRKYPNIKNNGNIKLLGELSNEELEIQMIKTDALIIYQPPTTGALTRIIEFLIAGIPVVTNFDGARNYHGVDGVYVYNIFDEIPGLINSIGYVPLLPPKPDYDYFITTIHNL